jgi:hypothetical protein
VTDRPEGDEVPTIEMLGDPGEDDPPAFARRTPLVVGLMGSPAALAIASLGLSLAALSIVQAASEIGDVYFESARHASSLGAFRVASGVRLGVALVALILAVIAAVRQVPDPLTSYLRNDGAAQDDELSATESAEVAPVWSRFVVGAALLLAVAAVLVNAAAFAYGMASHASGSSPFG